MQMVMAVFAYIYHQSFVVAQNISVDTILDQVIFEHLENQFKQTLKLFTHNLKNGIY